MECSRTTGDDGDGGGGKDNDHQRERANAGERASDATVVTEKQCEERLLRDAWIMSSTYSRSLMAGAGLARGSPPSRRLAAAPVERF